MISAPSLFLQTPLLLFVQIQDITLRRNDAEQVKSLQQKLASIFYSVKCGMKHNRKTVAYYFLVYIESLNVYIFML